MADRRQRLDCHDLRPTMPAVSLSDLPDDLLGHILSFAPLKEAASTSALARRWRTLYLFSGALNLDSRPRTRYSNIRDLHSNFRRDAMAAMAAYESSGFPVKKLTFYYDEWGKGEMRRRLDRLLSSPAARHLEELYFGRGYYGSMCSYSIITQPTFKSLRVLHITNCIDSHKLDHLVLVASVAFPRLTELRLYLCHVTREVLQAMIDASPLLNTLQLDTVVLSWCPEPHNCLSLPKVSTLLLENFNYGNCCDQRNLELDAPNLRCFTYKGLVRSISLKSPAPHIKRVELHFYLSNVHRNIQGKLPFNLFNVNRREVACENFWQFVSNFSSAKMVMLSFEPPDHDTPDSSDV